LRLPAFAVNSLSAPPNIPQPHHISATSQILTTLQRQPPARKIMGETPTIERFFLRNLLWIILAGILLILVTDLLIYIEDTLSIIIDLLILTSCLLSLALMKKFYTDRL
jgi:hypothetical protein